MTPSPSLLKMIAFFSEAKDAEISFCPVEVLHLAEGVIAVRDDSHGFDAYFDLEHWEAADPTSDFDAPFPSEQGLGVISKLLKYLPPGSAVSMTAFAPHVTKLLKPKEAAKWYKPLPPVQYDLIPRFNPKDLTG